MVGGDFRVSGNKISSGPKISGGVNRLVGKSPPSREKGEIGMPQIQIGRIQGARVIFSRVEGKEKEEKAEGERAKDEGEGEEVRGAGANFPRGW
jgi:hypothetical protein